MKSRTYPLLAFGAFLAVAVTASAHPGHMVGYSVSTGFAHPFSGWDHVLAMIAIGLWAAQLGGAARWRVPAAFVGTMILAGIAGRLAGALPGVDQGIAASVLVLGLLLATARRLPLISSLALAGLFAVFHGIAHGAEMPLAGNTIGYAGGFAAATAGLHLLGIGLGTAANRLSPRVPRYLGMALAAAGVLLFASHA